MSRNKYVWGSYSGRMGSSHLCGKKMVPQSTSSFKRALNKTEMYPPISVNMEVKCFPLPEYHSSVHMPRLWNVETFSEAVSILEKVPIMQPVYAHGGLLSISSEFSSAQRQENRGTAWMGNICHTPPRFLHGQERACSWTKPGWYLHVAQNHNCWTVDKIKTAGWKWQNPGTNTEGVPGWLTSLVLLPKVLVFFPFYKKNKNKKNPFNTEVKFYFSHCQTAEASTQVCFQNQILWCVVICKHCSVEIGVTVGFPTENMGQNDNPDTNMAQD